MEAANSPNLRHRLSWVGRYSQLSFYRISDGYGNNESDGVRKNDAFMRRDFQLVCDGRMDEHTDGRQTDEKTDGWRDGRMDGRKEWRTDTRECIKKPLLSTLLVQQ